MQRGAVILVVLLALAAVPLALLRRAGEAPTGLRPEEADRVYFVSAVLFEREKRDPSAARQQALAAHKLILSGTPLADVARAQSDDAASRDAGGFLGAVPVFLDNAQNLHGAVQMLKEGQLSGPVYTALGWYVLYRHPYQEGRALERRWRIPMWGFALPYQGIDGGGERTKEQAESQAREALAGLRSGALTLAQARARFGPTGGHEREDGWIVLLGRNGGTAALFDRLARVPEDAWLAEPVDAREGWGVFRRGRLLRSVVRHVLIQHVESAERPMSLTRLKPEALALAQKALAQVRGDLSRWDATVRAYSDELNTVGDRGSLGCVLSGTLPPELEAALLDTPPGEVCDRVVETPLGFHVLWRVD